MFSLSNHSSTHSHNCDEPLPGVTLTDVTLLFPSLFVSTLPAMLFSPLSAHPASTWNLMSTVTSARK